MSELKTRVFHLVLTAVTGTFVIACMAQRAEAISNAGTPHQFYGTVTSYGGLVGAGYTVTAVVNGQQVASTTTDAHGQWGYSPLFIVTAPANTNIEFYVNGVLSGVAAGCISTNRLDLVFNDPQKAASAKVVEPEVTGAFSSGGTVTFFIGQQPTSKSSTVTSQPETTQPVSITPVASIKVTELAVEPQTAEAGTDVSISVKLKNSGNVEFSGGVILKINDEVEQQKNIDLAVDESVALSFIVHRSEPGKYTATIDDLNTEFVIRDNQAAAMALPQSEALNSGGQLAAQAEPQPVNTEDQNKLIPDSPVLALAVIAVGLVLAIYLVSLIIKQGSSRY